MEIIKNILVLAAAMGLMAGLAYFGKRMYDDRNYAMLHFEKKKHDFDTLRTQEAAATYFVYKNTGNKPVRIEKVETTCGCTIPYWNQQELAPNQADSFKVAYNIENKGYFVKEVMVYSNSKNSPEHLFISGYVPLE
jgi:hypothetical protein